MDNMPKINESQIINIDFFKAIENQAICPICSYIFTNPVVCKKCEGIICKECSDKCVACPISRCSPVLFDKVPLSFKNTLNTVLIKCEVNGCSVPLLDYISHKEICNVNEQNQIHYNETNDPNLNINQKGIDKNYDYDEKSSNQHKLKIIDDNEHNNDQPISYVGVNNNHNENIENIENQANYQSNVGTLNVENVIEINEVERVKPENGSCGSNYNQEGKRIIYLFMDYVIPRLPKGLAILICVFNVILPGFGTMILECAYCNNKYQSQKAIIIFAWGLFHLIAFGFLIVYYHSIKTGFNVLMASYLIEEYDEGLEHLFDENEDLKFTDYKDNYEFR